MPDEIVVVAPAPASGTPPPPPPAPTASRSTRDIVNSSSAAFQAAVGGGPAGAPEPAAAPPAKPADASPASVPAAKSEPPIVAKPGETVPPAPAPPPPVKEQYTAEEFAAFEGNYHRRDFDWDRWPESLKDAKVFAQKVASGFGKRHADLDRERAAFEAERRKPAEAPQPPAAETQPKPGQYRASLEKFLSEDEATSAEGLSELLATPQGREAARKAGFSDPKRQDIVDRIVQNETVSTAIAAVSDGADAPFPQYISDEVYRDQVNGVMKADPMLLAKAQSGDLNEATFAFVVANGLVTAKRMGELQASVATREQAFAAREAQLVERENALKAQIEATNRSEPPPPAVRGNSAGAAARAGESMREIVQRRGPVPAA